MKLNEKQSADMIGEHKTQLLLTGQLSEFQLKNLKTWPMIVFEGLERVTINYDFQLDDESKDENALGLHAGIIIYDFEFQKNARITKKQKVKSLNQLVFWTKFLFWNDTQIKFRRKGRKWTL